MRKLLLPLNLIYRAGVYIRQKLYQYGIFKTTNLDTYIISIGNISAGGTGKTTLTQYISEYLLSKNKFIAVICKGYKRKSDDVHVAELGYENTERELTTENFGDESLLLFHNISDTIKQKILQGKGLLIASNDKTTGAKLAYRKFHPDVIIIDDAFQHIKLQRDLDIVLITDSKDRMLLPAGNLREPFKNIIRADQVVLNKKFRNFTDKIEKENPGIAICKYVTDGYFDTNDNRIILKDKEITAFCGIGDPNSFNEFLLMEKFDIKEFLAFSDHRNYDVNDIDKILNAYKNSGSKYIITTQKDFVRIRYTNNEETKQKYDELCESNLLYPKIRIEFIKNEDKMIDKINKRLHL